MAPPQSRSAADAAGAAARYRGGKRPGLRPGRITRGTPHAQVQGPQEGRLHPAAERHAGSGKPVKVAGPTHPVYVAVMLGLMLAGLAWLVVNYLAGDVIPFMVALGLVELPDRLLAHRDRAADDHAVALNSGNTRL